MSSITNRRVALGFVLLGLCITISLGSTGAFQTTTAERPISVTVADDDTAYVGYQSPSTLSFNVSSDERADIVTLRNQFHTRVRVTDVETNDVPVELSVPSKLRVGETASITLVDCDESLDGEPVHVTITVEGDDLRATVHGTSETRTIDVDCHA